MQNTNSNEFGRSFNNRSPNLQSIHTSTQDSREIRRAFAFKHDVNCDYASFENVWVDALGNQRTGKEPDRRCHLRYMLQSTRDPLGHKQALEDLKEFDRSWKR